jgi:hypothetical protein
MWSALPTTVDASMNVVTAQTTHLSTYGLVRVNQVDAGSTPDGNAPTDAGASLDAPAPTAEAGRDGPPPAKP